MREGLIDDTGYEAECRFIEECQEKAYQQGITDLLMPYDVDSIEELIENVKFKSREDAIEKIKGILIHRDYDFHKDGDYFTIEEVFEQLKEQTNDNI